MAKKIPLFIFVIDNVSGRRLRKNGIMFDSAGNKVLTTRKYRLSMDCNGNHINQCANLNLKKR